MVAINWRASFLIRAFSSRVKHIASTPFMFFIFLRSIEAGSKNFPWAVVIFISGSNESYNCKTKLPKPLNTESTIINAMLPTKTPITDINEIILMML